MSRKRTDSGKKRPGQTLVPAAGGTAGVLFERAAWWLFLALGALAPLAITNLSFGAASRYSITYDMVNLPKVVVIVVCAGLGLAAYAGAVATGRAKARYGLPLAFVWALAMWAALGAVVAPMHYRAVFGDFDHNEGVIAFCAYAVVATLAVQVLTDRARMRTICLVIGGSGALVALYGLLQFAHLDPLAWPSAMFGNRMFGTFENPDMLATFLVLPLALTLGLALSEPRQSWTTWFSAGASVAIETALVLSSVRGAWIGAAVAVLLVLAAVWRAEIPGEERRRFVVLAAVWVGALVLAAAVSSAVPQSGISVAERVSTTVASPLGGSVSERLATWRIAARSIAEKPVFGFGPDSFLDLFRAHADGSWWSAFGHSLSERDAHDLVLQYAATLGVPGALLALAAVATSLGGAARAAFARPARGSRLLYSAVFAGVAGLFVALLGSLTMAGVAVWLWLGVGVLTAARARTLDRPADALVRSLAILSAVVLVAFAGLGLSWARADAIAAGALREPIAEDQMAQMDRAIAANPLVHEYKLVKASIATNALQVALSSQPDAAIRTQWADRVVAAYAAAVDDDPHDALAAARLLDALNQRYEVGPDAAVSQRAVKAAETYAREWPNMPDVRNGAALAYLHAGRANDAVASARVAVALDPRYSLAWYTLGQAYAAANDSAQARQAYTQAVATDANNLDAAQALQSLEASATK